MIASLCAKPYAPDIAWWMFAGGALGESLIPLAVGFLDDFPELIAAEKLGTCTARAPRVAEPDALVHHHPGAGGGRGDLHRARGGARWVATIGAADWRAAGVGGVVAAGEPTGDEQSEREGKGGARMHLSFLTS